VKHVDVAIIGAGPAGLMAAIEAKSNGLSIVVLDKYSQPGGHYYKQPPTKFERLDVEVDNRLLQIRDLMERVSNLNIELLTDTTVWGIFRDHGPSFADRNGQACADSVQSLRKDFEAKEFSLYVACPRGVRCVRAKYIIVATGSYDRILPFPGWTLPGIITLGGAQMLLKGQKIVPGHRVLVAGSGPLLLAAAAGLAKAGANVLGVLDVAPFWDGWPGAPFAFWGQWARIREAWDYLVTLRQHKIPILFNHAVFRAIGQRELESVAIGKVDRLGYPVWDTEERLDVDSLCVGFGFLPNTALTRHLGCRHFYDSQMDVCLPEHNENLETSVPGVLVAGDITGIGGYELSMLQGQLAGLVSVRKIGTSSSTHITRRVSEMRSKIAKKQRFANMLRNRMRYRPGLRNLLDDSTVICRCENVVVSQIEDSIADGAQEMQGVKTRTRAGMGPCQGRYCDLSVGMMIAFETGRSREDVGFMSSRPPVIPLQINDLIAMD
jgi:NADPH-dependent 2,4-dienoyl-CoA reductase/sulfur reductase-like enzyme